MWPSPRRLASPGIIRHLDRTRFSIGEPDGTASRRCLDFSEAMVAGGLKCLVNPRLRDDIWIKLMGNAAMNPISALTRATMVEICQHPDTRRVVELMMEEALDIAGRLGSHPDISITKRVDGAERVGQAVDHGHHRHRHRHRHGTDGVQRPGEGLRRRAATAAVGRRALERARPADVPRRTAIVVTCRPAA